LPEDASVTDSTPALDRDFKTIDFLTLLDLPALAPSACQHFSF
jgi:hypothetical protein